MFSIGYSIWRGNRNHYESMVCNGEGKRVTAYRRQSMDNDTADGRSPSGRATQASPQTPMGLGHPVSVPNATMTPYGPSHPDYPNAPRDWDGGPYQCRDGSLYHMRGYGWQHGLGCWNDTASWDRVAYTAQGIEARRAEALDSVHESPAGNADAPKPNLHDGETEHGK